jgi:hypothetical protein
MPLGKVDTAFIATRVTLPEAAGKVTHMSKA